MRSRAGWKWITPSLLGACLAAVGLTAAGPVRADPPAPVGAVKAIIGLPYYRGPGADADRHRLDLYLPVGRKDFPVLVLVHGGAWIMGDRDFFGWGEDLGRYFAGRGFAVVMPTYRLTPAFKHPAQAQDLARAVAWTVRHIRSFGGDPDELFLVGHSAGGHLVSLLATDPSYLKAEGLSPSVIKGVVSVSGVYRIPDLGMNFKLPGFASDALHSLGSLIVPPGAGPARKAKPAPPQMPTGKVARMVIPLNLFRMVFGTDAKAYPAASPLHHVRPGLPPFLLVSAEHDLPLLPGMAREFAAALRAAGDSVQEMTVKDRDHEDVMFRATTADDPVARAVEAFVRAHLGKHAPASARTP